jgi:uncharacterized membrane protein YecN with MAPEG domain
MDMRARWRRRTAVVLTYLGYLVGVVACYQIPAMGVLTPISGLCALSAAVVFLGIFREGSDKPLFKLDERELVERYHSYYWALRILGVFSISSLVNAISHRRAWSANEVTGLLLEYLVGILTLPAAVTLWYAADPRELSGEMEAVEREA